MKLIEPSSGSLWTPFYDGIDFVLVMFMRSCPCHGESLSVTAAMDLEFQYRHKFEDPEAWTGTVKGYVSHLVKAVVKI